MHPSHKHLLSKLNRITGQIEAVKRMIDEERYCVDIMTQVRAARNALKAVELSILESHMHSCLSKASCENTEHQHERIGEILALLRKYE